MLPQSLWWTAQKGSSLGISHPVLVYISLIFLFSNGAQTVPSKHIKKAKPGSPKYALQAAVIITFVVLVSLLGLTYLNVISC